MLARLILLQRLPLSPSFGRLVLRIVVFLTMFLRHGTEKLFSFSLTLQHFNDPHRVIDPLHIGTFPTLVIAAIADGICSLLIMLGLATRWAALFQTCSLFVVWSFVDHFETIHSPQGIPRGEPVVLYMGACLALFFLGAGKFSIDGLIESAQENKRRAEPEQVSAARA
jgi:putative oxidoreductase